VQAIALHGDPGIANGAIEQRDAAGFEPQQNFLAMAIPAVIAAGAVSMINHRRSASAQRELATAPVQGEMKEA
jgi:hypothetical protein